MKISANTYQSKWISHILCTFQIYTQLHKKIYEIYMINTSQMRIHVEIYEKVVAKLAEKKSK